MTFLKAALELASLGFHVFPLNPNSKTPAIPDFPEEASTDPAKIRAWWMDEVMEMEQPYNIGISTTHFRKSEALVVIDVDNKGLKNGDERILELELDENREFPQTFEQKTPTGGRHLVYRTPTAIKQGVDVLGKGLDIRSFGGYIVGAGSSLEGGAYSAISRPLGLAPEWILSGRRDLPEKRSANQALPQVDQKRAESRAIEYLQLHAPLSIKGQGGDQTAYRVAAKVKDFGVSATAALELMLTHWNERCPPGWSASRLKEKVDHAYRYGNDPVGVLAPETQFEKYVIDEGKEEKALHPFDVLNQEFAYVRGANGYILHETTDHEGKYYLQHLDPNKFHTDLASFKMTVSDGGTKPVSKLWIQDQRRRTYDGIIFAPGTNSKRFYNLWRGYPVKPLVRGEIPTPNAKASLDAFLEHSLENICGGEVPLHNYLITYFAQLVQKPWEKPLVSLVFKGLKGTGKNALVERVGYLLGDHFGVVSDQRHLTGNFNSFLENKLMLVLDEAFWSGDKRAEGMLKHLITGEHHIIERKGQEPYKVRNFLRTVIIGNEDWIIPATSDERRFAVFGVGNKRKQDRKFFKDMRVNMEEQGGYALLLRYLLDYDCSKIDVSEAPNTQALAAQKLEALRPIQQWWHDSLSEGLIEGLPGNNEWINDVNKNDFREAYNRYAQTRNISGWKPTSTTFLRELRKACPSIKETREQSQGERLRTFNIPTLLEARQEFDVFIGYEMKWSDL